MITLKRITHHATTNSLEVTWVDRVSVEPYEDENGSLVTYTDTPVKCHSYADVQLGMLREDAAALATPLDAHAALLAQVEAASPPPVAAAPIVPQSVTMRQARLALLAAGLLPAVEAAVAALPEPDKTAAQITWEFAATVDRWFGMVPQLAAALGMTEAQIDNLFIEAAKL